MYQPHYAIEALNSNCVFLPGVFEETLDLLFDAHQYFNLYGQEDQANYDPIDRTSYSNEMTRITLRLTSIMAWVMVRRAIHAGRIDDADGNDHYRLEGVEAGAHHQPESLRWLPQEVQDLAEKSYVLFQRVMRLDDMVYGAAA